MEEEVLRDEETLIIQASTLIVLLCMAASGNGVLIFVYARDYRMRTATNMLVVSHTLAEFSFSIVGICVYSLTAATRSPLYGGFCTAYGSLNMFFFYASLLSLTFISVDRFLAVVKQIHHRITRQHVRVVICFIWFQALINAVPWDLALVGKPGKRYVAWVLSNCEPFFSVPNHGYEVVNAFRIIIMVISFLVPVLAICYTSFHILRTALKNKKRVHVLGTIVNNRVAADAYSKSAFTTVIIIAVYFLCIVPSIILYTVSKLTNKHIAALHIISTAAMSFRSACYPLIFTARNRKFSNCLRSFFAKRLKLCRRANPKIHEDSGHTRPIGGHVLHINPTPRMKARSFAARPSIAWPEAPKLAFTDLTTIN